MFGEAQIERSYSSVKECKPNYEEMAALLKRKIDANKRCLDGMKDGIAIGSISLGGDREVLYYAIIGSLSMMIPKQENEYESLLKMIEEEK